MTMSLREKSNRGKFNRSPTPTNVYYVYLIPQSTFDNDNDNCPWPLGESPSH